MSMIIKVRFVSNGVEKEAEYTYDYFKKAFGDEWQRVREAWEHDWMNNHDAPETDEEADELLALMNAAYDVAFDPEHIMATWNEYANTAIDASHVVEILGVYEA